VEVSRVTAGTSEVTSKVPLVVAVTTIVLVAITAMILTSFRDQAERSGRDGVLEIVMEDYTLRPSEFVLPAGEPVTLMLTNTQGFAHNFEFGRSLVEQIGHPVGSEEDLLAGVDARVTPPQAWIAPGAGDHVTISVAGNSTVTAEFVLPGIASERGRLAASWGRAATRGWVWLLNSRSSDRPMGATGAVLSRVSASAPERLDASDSPGTCSCAIRPAANRRGIRPVSPHGRTTASASRTHQGHER
jgi:hypothetical protein